MITIRCDECSEVFFDSRDERRSNLEQLATDTPFEDDMVMCWIVWMRYLKKMKRQSK